MEGEGNVLSRREEGSGDNLAILISTVYKWLLLLTRVFRHMSQAESDSCDTEALLTDSFIA